MRNAQIEIADIAGQVDTLRQALEVQMEELRARQAEIAEQLKAVQHSVTALEAQSSKVSSPPGIEQPAPVPRLPEPARAQVPAAEGISEEVMLVIAAAVAAFVGKSARIRSARHVEGVSPWAQQGRVFVQASHNLPHHG